MPQITEEIIDLFWSRVDKRSPNECWEWQGTRDYDGYGKLNYRGSSFVASRLAYELTFGPIPKGRFGCHRCGNPPCCNPDHIYAGTPHDNAMDAIKAGRWNNGRKVTPLHRLSMIFNEEEYQELSKLAHAAKTTGQQILKDFLRTSSQLRCIQLESRKEENND